MKHVKDQTLKVLYVEAIERSNLLFSKYALEKVT